MKLAKLIGALAIGGLGAYFGLTLLSEPWAIWSSGVVTCFSFTMYWETFIWEP